MKKVNKWWIALLLGALLMVTLVGVVWARPKASPAYKVTIPGAHFHPKQDGHIWRNQGNYITVDVGSGVFYAALPIALPGRFTIEKFTLFAYDFNGSDNISAHLFRMNSWTNATHTMAEVITQGQSMAVQIVSTTSISPDTVYGGHGAFVKVYIPSQSNLNLWAVQIEYH